MNNISYKKIFKIIESSKKQAIKDNSDCVLIEHITERLFQQKEFCKMLYKYDYKLFSIDNIITIKQEIREIINGIIKEPKSILNIKPCNELEKVLYHSRLQSLFFDKSEVDYIDIFIAILYCKSEISSYFKQKWNIEVKDILVYYSEKYSKENNLERKLSDIKEEDLLKKLEKPYTRKGEYNKDVEGEVARQKFLNSMSYPNNNKSLYEKIEPFCKNMNELVKNKKQLPIINRSREYRLLEQTINRMLKPNALLIGPSGVGKTAIVEGFVSEINKGNIESLKNYTIYLVDIGCMVAGTKFRGDFEEKMKNLLAFASKCEKTLFFIDEFHLIVGAGSGSESTIDVANLLKPALARGDICVIGATTDKEYRANIENDKALNRRFYKITVNEPTKEDMLSILNSIKYKFNEYYNIVFNKESLKYLIYLCDKFQQHLYFPDKAIDILDSIGSAYGKKSEIEIIDKLKVIEQFSFLTGINPQLLSTDDKFDYRKVKRHLEENIIGQSEAINQISDIMTLSYSGIREKNKTILSVLLRGQTGIGKTEFAKQLSTVMNLPLIRLDMSEFNEAHSISKLIGSPSGYVGYGDGDAGSGILINKIETQPNSILLLDEIEKAHYSVINLLLQVMDNGNLMSSSGKVISFQNVILLMTSNIGAREEVKNGIGFIHTMDSSEKGEEDMKSFFAPEFLNRLDMVIRFNQLSLDNIQCITELKLNKLRDLLLEQNIVCNIDQAVCQYITEMAYNEKHNGARPINRYIDKLIKIPLSKFLLDNNKRLYNISINENKIIIE